MDQVSNSNSNLIWSLPDEINICIFENISKLAVHCRVCSVWNDVIREMLEKRLSGYPEGVVNLLGKKQIVEMPSVEIKISAECLAYKDVLQPIRGRDSNNMLFVAVPYEIFIIDVFKEEKLEIFFESFEKDVLFWGITDIDWGRLIYTGPFISTTSYSSDVKWLKESAPHKLCDILSLKELKASNYEGECTIKLKEPSVEKNPL